LELSFDDVADMRSRLRGRGFGSLIVVPDRERMISAHVPSDVLGASRPLRVCFLSGVVLIASSLPRRGFDAT